jgi:uncharacterized membrane protein YkvA (DUF1232 family)
MDRRVPMRLKALPALALAYIVSPVDILPDLVPLLGQLDDIVVATALLALFAALAPAALAKRQPPRDPGRSDRDDGKIIEGNFRYVDED